MDNFDAIDRGYQTIWVHKSSPSWVVYYPETNDTKSFYQAYTVKDYCLPVPKGSNCWSLDNRRLSKDRVGFKSLAEACSAIEMLAK